MRAHTHAPRTQTLQVLANCFINSTYTPARNGTCPDQAGQYYTGFQWENGGGGRQDSWETTRPIDWVAYAPDFPVYAHMTASFVADVTMAVNTALNYII